MGNLEQCSRKAGSQKLGEIPVEVFDLLGTQSSANSRAGPNAASPRFGSVRGIDIVREGLQAPVPRFTEVAKPQRMNTQPTPQLPLRIVALDQFFCGTGQVAGERNPVELFDHQSAVGFENPRGFRCRQATVELVPALPCGDDVKGRVCEAGVLCPGHPVVDLDTSHRVERSGGLKHLFSGVDPDDVAAAASETRARVPVPVARSAMH
jgi:hypothetical protein